MDILLINNDLTDVTLSSGIINNITLSAANELTIEMSGATNGESLTVAFPGIAYVNDINYVVQDTLCIRQLVGDVRPDGVINSLDRVDVRDAMGNAVDASNFRADVRADGTFSSTDRVDVRDAMGTALIDTCP